MEDLKVADNRAVNSTEKAEEKDQKKQISLNEWFNSLNRAGRRKFLAENKHLKAVKKQ